MDNGSPRHDCSLCFRGSFLLLCLYYSPELELQAWDAYLSNWAIAIQLFIVCFRNRWQLTNQVVQHIKPDSLLHCSHAMYKLSSSSALLELLELVSDKLQLRGTINTHIPKP